MTITMTEAACGYIKQRLEAEHHSAFRLTIKKTGCSGYTYLPELVDEAKPTDMTLAINGVTIFVDTTWLALLQGVQVDYVEEVKLGLKQKRLVFTNPNESSRCGCGESFHVS